MSDIVMTHGYEIDWDMVLGNPHYLLATIAGQRVRIPVAKQVVYAIRTGGRTLGLEIEEHANGANWNIPIGEAITRQMYMEKKEVVK